MFPPNTRILIVDDMKTMRSIVRKALSDLGLKNVTDADDGAVAWPLIETSLQTGSPFELIVSDWNMPKMTGLELLKMVRAHPQLKSTPFVLLTAEAEKTQVMEAIQSGVSQYITKPFTTEMVREKLTKVHASLAGKKSA